MRTGLRKARQLVWVALGLTAGCEHTSVAENGLRRAAPTPVDDASVDGESEQSEQPQEETENKAEQPTSPTRELAPVRSRPVPKDVASASCSTGAGAATWDATTRKLSFGGLWWALNEQGLIVSKGQVADPVWRHEFTYDAHQTVASFSYYWQEQVVPANSWTRTNLYDESGRLTHAYHNYLDIAGHVLGVTYAYAEDGQLTSESAIYTVDVLTSPGGATVTRYVREGGLVREVTREFAEVIFNRTRAFYDDDGRLVRLDSDGHGLAPSPDGTPDIRFTWAYDERGNCTEFTQDGTEILDAPVVDGVPDETLTFDAACASIAFLPHELYRYPAWYSPR